MNQMLVELGKYTGAITELKVTLTKQRRERLIKSLSSFNQLITAVNGQVPAANAVDCDIPAAAPYSSWAAQVTLNDGSFFCVDSSGFAGTRVTTKGATATACAAS